jgi:hypothetical protein
MKEPMETSDGMEIVDAVRHCQECGREIRVRLPRALVDIVMSCDECATRKAEAARRQEIIDYRRRAVERSGIAPRYLIWDRQKASETGSAALLPWIAARKDGSLWIAGANNTGKTHAISYAAYRMIVDYATPVRMIRASEFLLSVVQSRQGSREDIEAGQELVRDALACGILVLDDLGKERLSDAKAEILWELIDLRERDSKRLWITTNISGAELEARLGSDYGPAIMERLRRACPEARRWPEIGQIGA